MSTIKITDENFEKEVLQASVPVLVDFWAEWCGPCRMLSPILDEVAQELGATAKITKLNIEESPQSPNTYGVRSIPTMILFLNGQVVDTKVGTMPKTKIIEWVQSVL